MTATLLAAKSASGLSFEDLASWLGRDEVAVAAIFFGQARASDDDVRALASVLELSIDELLPLKDNFPMRGVAAAMPPKEPLIYRLYEIVQTYGMAYKAVLNEKFGDGIMSAVSFSTKVDKEVDASGAEWAVITLRGKWLPFSRF